MNRSTPSLPVHHQLLEFTQTHVHQVGDVIQPSYPLSFPSPPAPNPSQHQDLFQRVNSVGKLCPRTYLESTFAGQVLCFLVLFYLGWFEKSRCANWLMHDLIFWLSTPHFSSTLSTLLYAPRGKTLWSVYPSSLVLLPGYPRVGPERNGGTDACHLQVPPCKAMTLTAAAFLLRL